MKPISQVSTHRRHSSFVSQNFSKNEKSRDGNHNQQEMIRSVIEQQNPLNESSNPLEIDPANLVAVKQRIREIESAAAGFMNNPVINELASNFGISKFESELTNQNAQIKKRIESNQIESKPINQSKPISQSNPINQSKPIEQPRPIERKNQRKDLTKITNQSSSSRASESELRKRTEKAESIIAAISKRNQTRIG